MIDWKKNYEHADCFFVGEDLYERPVAHLYTCLSDESVVDALFVGHPREAAEDFELRLWSEFERTERDCSVHNRVDKTRLVTDDFGWHSASRTEDGRIRIESGYDARQAALSRESVEEYDSMADCFVRRWQNG